MTALLDQAVAALAQLPAEEQDRIATLILEEVTDDARWEEAFAQSSDALSRIAARVRQDRRTGKARVQGFDEL